MKPSTLFSICNTIAPLAWLLMIISPRWKVTKSIVLNLVIPLFFSIVYGSLLFSMGGISFSDFGSLEGIKKLFSNDYALVLGWIHFLAFDLFVGSWILFNSQRNGLPHLLIIPCLLGTFMFGPIGLLLYVVIRGVKTKKLLHENL